MGLAFLSGAGYRDASQPWTCHQELRVGDSETNTRGCISNAITQRGCAGGILLVEASSPCTGWFLHPVHPFPSFSFWCLQLRMFPFGTLLAPLPCRPPPSAQWWLGPALHSATARALLCHTGASRNHLLLSLSHSGSTGSSHFSLLRTGPDTGEAVRKYRQIGSVADEGVRALELASSVCQHQEVAYLSDRAVRTASLPVTWCPLSANHGAGELLTD